MSLLQKLKDFLDKKTFDFDSPNISLYAFHPQLQILFLFNGIFFNNRESKLRYIWPTLSIALSFVAVAFEIMFVYRGIVTEDYSFATECFVYCLLLSSISIVYISILFNRDIIMNLLNDMNYDFTYISSLSDRYRQPFLKGQLQIWKLFFAWLSFVTLTAMIFIFTCVVALLHLCLFATQDEHMVRPMIFPMWLPEDDPYRTPNYEIFMAFEVLLSFIFLTTFCVYVYVLFHTLLHYLHLMEMIILDFLVIFDGLDEEVVNYSIRDPRRVEVQLTLNSRIKRIVTWHRSVLKSIASVSSMYGPPLVYQVMISSIVICLVVFQVTVQLENGKFDFRFALLAVGAIAQLWIPCYLGTTLRNKAFEVGDSCWNCGWHITPLGRLVRADIVIFIRRTQKPLTIKFIGLPDVQLETFSSIMSSAYSYYNMLRQYSKK